jgi:hypothetical protein
MIEERMALFTKMLLRAQWEQMQAGNQIAIWLTTIEALKRENSDDLQITRSDEASRYP